VKFLIRLIVNGAAFYYMAKYIPGIHASDFWHAVLAAFIFGVVNAIIRPVLLFLTFPLTMVTVGLFVLVVNGLMFWLATWIAPGFKVDGLVPALEGGLIMTVIGMITSALLKEHRRRRPIGRATS
jgi:putative membrane protein